MAAKRTSDDFEIRRKLLRMELLYDVGLALGQTLDPAVVAREILHRTLVMLDARGALLLARREADGMLYCMGEQGLDDQDEAERFLSLSVMEETWAEAVPHHLQRPERAAWRYLCIVPLQSRGEVNGLLVVADKEGRDGIGPFEAEDEALLQAFAYQAGASLHNTRLHHNLERTYRQLQEAQKQLAQMEHLRALGDLAAEMAHSMRHTLGLIVGRADASLSLGSDPRAALEAVVRAAEEGLHTVERIEVFTRLGARRKRVEIQLNIVVKEAWEHVLEILGPRAEGIRVDSGLGELPPTWANPADLKEIFVNLLLNAVEAMPGGGTVGLRTEADGTWIRVRIADAGAGMDAETLRRAFEPFYTTKEERGHGLGLGIVSRLVDAHGGRVRAESAPGKGSVFTVELPIAGPPAEDAQDDGVADLDH